MSATSSRRSSALILGPLDRLAAFVFALVFAIVFPRRSKLALTHYLVKGHLRTNVADVEPPSFRRSTQQLRHLLSGVWQRRICCGRPVNSAATRSKRPLHHRLNSAHRPGVAGCRPRAPGTG